MNATAVTEGTNDLSADVYPIASVVVPVFFSLIAITGVIGNVLVILVVVLNPQMRSTTNLLIVNLAIADLLFLIFCIPFTGAQYITEAWLFGEIWCKIVQYLIVVTAHASIYILVLMSVDRYLAVVHPVSSRAIRTEYNTKIAIAVLWTVILILSLPVSFAHGLQTYDEHYVECQLLEEGFLSRPAYFAVFFATSYVMPLIAICCLYVRMIDRLWHTMVGNEMSSESQKGRRRVTRLVVVVVVAFALLWLPIQLILVLRAFGVLVVDTPAKVLMQIFAQIIAYTSSCINPLLYAFLSKNFRTAFQKVVTSKGFCRPCSMLSSKFCGRSASQTSISEVSCPSLSSKLSSVTEALESAQTESNPILATPVLEIPPVNESPVSIPNIFLPDCIRDSSTELDTFVHKDNSMN